MSKNTPKGLSITDRLAAARDADEVAEILGRRRRIAHALAFLTIALGAGAYGAYLVVTAALEPRSAWWLALLPACMGLAAFFGVVAYGGLYQAITGRRPSRRFRERVERVAARLNSNLWPRS